MPLRRPSIRRSLALLACLPLVAAVAACSGGSSSGTGSAASGASCAKSSGKVNLTFWSWVPGMDKAVALWNQEHPEVKVTLKTTPAGNAGTYQNMFNALKAGTAPDLGQIEYDSLASFRLQQGLSDIGACAPVAAASSSFVPWTWSQVTFGGGGKDGVWAVPEDTGPMALFYRKDLFTKYHLPVPTTWDQYYQDAVALKKADPSAYITHLSQTDPNWFTGLLWQGGSSMFSQSGDSWKVSVNSAANQKVAAYWQKMVDQKLVATNIQGWSTALYKAWNDGTVATWISAAWGYSTIRDNAAGSAGKWAVAPMPQWSASDAKAGNWGGSTTAVLASSKHPYEASEFAVWLNTDPKALAILNSKGGLYPAAKAGLDLPALQKGVPFYGGQKIFDIFKKASSEVDTSWTWGPTMTDTYRFMSDGIAGVTGGSGTMSGMLGDTQTKTVNSLKQQSLQVTQ